MLVDRQLNGAVTDHRSEHTDHNHLCSLDWHQRWGEPQSHKRHQAVSAAWSRQEQAARLAESALLGYPGSAVSRRQVVSPQDTYAVCVFCTVFSHTWHVASHPACRSMSARCGMGVAGLGQCASLKVRKCANPCVSIVN